MPLTGGSSFTAAVNEQCTAVSHSVLDQVGALRLLRTLKEMILIID